MCTMQGMEQEAQLLSPLLQKAEVLLVLLVVLAASITWLFWELFSFVNRESDDNGDWWEELKNCNHKRLIIPPECVVEIVEPGALSRLTLATSDAVKKMTGVVSSGLQRTGNLITRSAGKPLTKAQKKGSRADLASMANEQPGAKTGKDRRKGSRQNLAAGVNEGSTSPTSDKPLGGHHRSRSRLDLTEELAGEGATQKSQQAKKGGATKGEGGDGRRGSRGEAGPLSPDAASAANKADGASLGGVSEPHVVSGAEHDGRTPQQKQQSSRVVPTAQMGKHPSRSGSLGNGVGRPLLFHPLPDDCTPLLTFVNSRSGVSQGTYLIHQLRRLLNPIQVVDLATEEPHRALRQFLELPRLRVLVCGGDGTAKWIMNVLEELQVDCWPPIAILPLGTGNDMARVLGWGGGYNNESIVEFLAQVQRAHVVVVDRWEMTVTTGKGRSEKSRVTTFNNYFGIGVDAQAALKFHHLREQKPQLFFSRLVNKMWYGFLGAQDLWKRSCVNLPTSLKVMADGKEVELPPSVQGIMFLNIGSWGGGVKLWHDEEGDKDGAVADFSVVSKLPLQTASMQDGLLELVAVNGVVHLGQLQVGLSKAVKICQCSEVTITTARDLPMQIDGEPWGQPKGTIKISRKLDPAYMLKRTMDTGGAVATEMSELLDWAQSTGVISVQQKKSLLTEFSRRVEHRRRTFEQESGLLGGEAVKSFEMGGRRLSARDLQRPKDCIIS